MTFVRTDDCDAVNLEHIVSVRTVKRTNQWGDHWVVRARMNNGEAFDIYPTAWQEAVVQLIPAEPGTLVLFEQGDEVEQSCSAERATAWALCADGEIRPVTVSNGVVREDYFANCTFAVEHPDGSVASAGEWYANRDEFLTARREDRAAEAHSKQEHTAEAEGSP